MNLFRTRMAMLMIMVLVSSFGLTAFQANAQQPATTPKEAIALMKAAMDKRDIKYAALAMDLDKESTTKVLTVFEIGFQCSEKTEALLPLLHRKYGAEAVKKFLDSDFAVDTNANMTMKSVKIEKSEDGKSAVATWDDMDGKPETAILYKKGNAWVVDFLASQEIPEEALDQIILFSGLSYGLLDEMPAAIEKYETYKEFNNFMELVAAEAAKQMEAE